MLAILLLAWIYIGIRAIYEAGKGSASDERTRQWAKDKGYRGYYDHNGKWIEF